MLIDQLCIFFDNADAAASANSAPVSVSPFSGRDEPVNVTVILSGAGTATLAVTFQESDDQTTWANVGSFNLNKTNALAHVLTFNIPYPTRKKFVRLAYALTGTPTGLKVFAAVTRDHFAPYAPGQYIDAGNVVLEWPGRLCTGPRRPAASAGSTGRRGTCSPCPNLKPRRRTWRGLKGPVGWPT
jgi:hypothetical protein